MDFINQIDDFQYKKCGVSLKQGERIAGNEDLFFRAKQEEICEQYYAARLFLQETSFQDERVDKYLLSLTEQYKSDCDMTVYLKGLCYECSLMYYNIVVDLTWVLTYVCIEDFFYRNQFDVVKLKGIQDVKSAREAMMYYEENACSPSESDDIFLYIKSLAPSFCTVIDQVIIFWNKYRNSNNRKRYNYIKHRGKPFYSEMDEDRVFNAFSIAGNSLVQLASSVSDVSNRYSLNDAIKELKDFDDKELFPYVSNLIKDLERIVNPLIV